MINNRNVLKNAFIDAQRDIRIIEPHDFSDAFEKKMSFLIKSQEGIMRIINTASKRVAIIVFTCIITMTSMVFGVEAIRTPVVKAIQEFFVNVKQQLSGTMAGNIAHLMSDEVVELHAISYTASSPKTEVIKDTEKIKEFVDLLTYTEWLVPPDKTYYEESIKDCIWEFILVDSKGEQVSIRACSIGSRGVVTVSANGETNTYTLSRDAYRSIISFTGIRYYLHKSDAKQPEKEYLLGVKAKILSGLDEKEKESVQTKLWNIHYRTENFLLSYVTILKDPDSKLWDYCLYGGHNEDDHVYSPDGFSEVLTEIRELEQQIDDSDTKELLLSLCDDLEYAFAYHDIGTIFTVHEYIHDLDYFAVDYPKSCDTPPPDWNGVYVYFGRIEKIYGKNIPS